MEKQIRDRLILQLKQLLEQALVLVPVQALESLVLALVLAPQQLELELVQVLPLLLILQPVLTLLLLSKSHQHLLLFHQ
jgi:hypothetical protein